MQQSYAGAIGVQEAAQVTELADDALRIHEDSLARQQVQVLRHYEPVPALALDRTRVMQILLNLVENARQAMEAQASPRTLSVSITLHHETISIAVQDNGCGIAAENLQRIFSHGFSTKADGHGFGLHSCAVAAREMGGTLTAYSDGPGTGATFVLRLPVESAAAAGG